jgi:hypothetical protein
MGIYLTGWCVMLYKTTDMGDRYITCGIIKLTADERR